MMDFIPPDTNITTDSVVATYKQDASAKGFNTYESEFFSKNSTIQKFILNIS